MPQIHVLPVHLRNKIAAGEVIERPASVVKELLENALDAGASDIVVEVRGGGKRLIRVSDDGCGMERDDAVLCFERHATSKLKDEADLFNIVTLGFRGEAMPSIASVSKVVLSTALKGASSGVSIEIDGGEVRQVRDAASVGTTIEVRELFFNTPARKKFLKTDNTELLHIIDTVTREALSHFGAGFTLITDSHETMRLPRATGLKERLIQIYGDEFVKGLMEVSKDDASRKMLAFLSNTDNFRATRSHQFVFINGRPVRDQSVSHAIYRGYEGILPSEKHPIFFLFLELDPRVVDFNVHPTKREVRFADKESVYRFVQTGVGDAAGHQRREFARQFSEPFDPNSEAVQVRPHYGPANESPSSYPVGRIAEMPEFSYRPALPHLYLGETFIAVAGKGGVTLIDHHAAHERILYERLLTKVGMDSAALLFPQQVKLSSNEYRVLLKEKELLAGLGIEIDDFGHDTVIVRSLPAGLEGSDIRGIMTDAAAAIIEGVRPERSLKEDIAARIACHSSVRGREVLSSEEVGQLLHDLENAGHPDLCPHGRPTRIFLSLDDLKKMFRRK